MARNRMTCKAPCERVFAVLEDPRPYAHFVVGTNTIRRFDPRWPEPGSAFHHSLGVVGLTLIRDRTVSVECDPPRRLALKAGMRPLAVNDTVFVLTPTGDGATVVEIEETPVAGPACLPLVGPVVDRLLGLRNRLLLRRLCAVVEARQRRAGGASG